MEIFLSKKQICNTVFDIDTSSIPVSGQSSSNKNEPEIFRSDTAGNKYELHKSFEPLKKRACIGNIDFNIEVALYNWKFITAENLNLKYARVFNKHTADYILQRLEQEVEYFSGELLKVRVFGKWHDIPRKQVSFGDPGLSYSFSGTSVPAVPWSKCKIIMELKQIVESMSGHSFNFVLVNRYKDGLDHMGEHRDDEKDLVFNAPIASLSIGQARDFIFKHKDSRSKSAVCKIPPVKLELEHGSLLLMLWPTNRFWYHSLPVRKKAVNIRVNLTFRKMVTKV